MVELKASTGLFANYKGREVMEKDAIESFKFWNKGHEVKPCYLNQVFGGKEIKEPTEEIKKNLTHTKEVFTNKNLSYVHSKEVISKTGKIDENKWMK